MSQSNSNEIASTPCLKVTNETVTRGVSKTCAFVLGR